MNDVMLRAEYLQQTGALPPKFDSVSEVGIGIVKLTDRAHSALADHDAEATLLDPKKLLYDLKLGDTVPDGLVAVRIGGANPAVAVRVADEARYDDEVTLDLDLQINLIPCPECGARLQPLSDASNFACIRVPCHHVRICVQKE